MAKARVQPVKRPASSPPTKRRRKRVVSNRAASFDLSIPSFAIPPKVLAGLAAVAGILALPWLIPALFDVISFVSRGMIEVFGIGLLPVSILMALSLWLAAGRPLPASQDALRSALGIALLIVAFNGITSLYRPVWQIGGVSIEEATAGGRIGSIFTDSAAGALALIVLLVAGLGLAWPRSLVFAGGSTMWFGKHLLELQIPQRVGRLLGRALVAFVPKSYEPKPDSTQLPGVLPPTNVSDYALLDEESFEVIEGNLADDEDEGSPKRLAKAQTKSLAPGANGDGFAAMHPLHSAWETPAIDILKATVENGTKTTDNNVRAQLIMDTLRSFGVDAKVVQINQGPTVTQFGIEPGWEIKTRTVAERDVNGRIVYDKDGSPKSKTEVVSRTRVRVNQITALANDLALSLAAPSIRIEAPVPGKPIIGIEVPNSSPSVVTLRAVV